MLNKKLTTAIILTIFPSLFAQWSSNTNVNLQICDLNGEQVLPKISGTADGGCYIAWFDSRSGGYAVYLQRLNSLGEKQFAADGLLISNNTQNSSLVDWDMMTDAANNAVIVFTDIRSGTVNPFAYRISPQGTFLWGSNGVALSTGNSTYQPNPKVSATSDDNFVIFWIFGSTPRKVALQKLNGAGVKQWGTDPIYLAGGGSENFDWPALVPSDNGSVILLWSGYTGTFLNPQNYRLYTQKYSSGGTPVWNSTQDTVYSLGRVSGFYTPRIFSDGNNGAIYCWRDDRNSTNLQSAYVQRKNSAGAFLFPVNGSAGSTLAGFNHFDPVAAYVASANETFIFWTETNTSQSQFGIYGQKFSGNGSRLWNDAGVAFKPMDGQQPSYISTLAKDTNVIVYYNESQSANNNFVKSFKIGRSGVIGWGGNIIVPGSLLSTKLRLASAINNSGMSMLTWTDGRNDNGGVYAQNINLDGTFGNTTGITTLSETAEQYSLFQNYPNPFNPITIIRFSVPLIKGGEGGLSVQLKIHDILGREIASLVSGKLSTGIYEIEWNADMFPSGVYFCRMEASDPISEQVFVNVKKMVLIK